MACTLARVHEHTTVPLVVECDVASRADVDAVSDAGAQGVVIGSALASIIGASDDVPQRIEAYCRDLCENRKTASVRSVCHLHPPTTTTTTKMIPPSSPPPIPLPMRFGEFGGRYVPEVLHKSLLELDELYQQASADPGFWNEFEGLYGFMNRPSALYFAEKLTAHAGGARIWFKREDLNHTGSHKINNAVGQVRVCVYMKGWRCLLVVDSAGATGGETARGGGDGSGTAWGGDGDGVCAVRDGVCDLHGVGGRASTGAERVPDETARGQGA